MQFDELKSVDVAETVQPVTTAGSSFDNLVPLETKPIQADPIEETVPDQPAVEPAILDIPAVKEHRFISSNFQKDWEDTKTIGDVASEMAIGAVSFIPSFAKSMKYKAFQAFGEAVGYLEPQEEEITVQIANQMAADVHHFIGNALRLGMEHQPTEDAQKALAVVETMFTAPREKLFKPVGDFYERVTGSKIGGSLTTDALEILFFTALPEQIKGWNKKRLVAKEKAVWEDVAKRDRFRRAMEAKLEAERKAVVAEVPRGKTREQYYKEGSVESIFGKEAAWEIDRAWAELDAYEAKQKMYEGLLKEENSVKFLDDVEAFVERRDIGIEGKVKGEEIESLYNRFIKRQKEENVTFKKDWDNWKKAEKHVEDMKLIPRFDPREYMIADHMGKKMAVRKEPKTVDLKFEQQKVAEPLIVVEPASRPKRLFEKKQPKPIKPKDRQAPVIEKQQEGLSKLVEEITAEEMLPARDRSRVNTTRKKSPPVKEGKTAESFIEEAKSEPLETPGVPDNIGDAIVLDEKIQIANRATETGSELLRMLKEIKEEMAAKKVSTAPEMAKQSERVRELEIMDEMDTFFMEESPVYRNEGSWSESMMDETVRSADDIFGDLTIISEDILFNERGSISFEKLPSETAAAVSRLMKDLQVITRNAATAGKKIGEYLVERGYDPDVAKAFEKYAKDATQSEKIEIRQPERAGNGNRVDVALSKAKEKTKVFSRENIVEKGMAFAREFIARDAKVRSVLGKESDPLSWSAAHKAEMAKVAAANSSSAATQQFTIWKKQIFDKLNPLERTALDSYIWVMKELDIIRRHPKYKSMKGIEKADLVDWYKNAQDHLKLNDASMEKVMQASQDYFDAFRDLLGTKHREGAIPTWLYEQLKENTYSPTEWLHMQDMMQFANERGISLQRKGPTTIEEYARILEPHIKAADPKMSTNTSGVQRLKGGTEGYQKLDAYELLETATQETWRWVMNNRANKYLADYATTVKLREVPFEERVVTPGHKKQIKKDGQYFDEIFFDEGGQPYFEYKKAPKGWKEVNYFIDGSRETVWAKDWFAEQWSLGGSEFRNQWSGALRIASGSAFKREFATGAANPFFFLKGLPMDMMYTYGRAMRRGADGRYKSLYSPHLPVYLVELVRNWAKVAPDVLARKGEFTKAVEQGLGTNFLTQTGGVSPVFRGKVASGIDSIRQFTGYMNTSAEVLMRLANREQFKKKGYPDWQATAAAWDMLAYDQGGRVAKHLDDVMAYTNVGIQATRGLVKAAKRNPVEFGVKQAWLGGLASALYVWNRSNAPRAIDNESKYRKDGYFVVTTGKTMTDHMGQEYDINFYIRKDPAQAVITTMAELMTARSMGEREDFDRLLNSLRSQLPYIEGFPIPTLEAALTYVHNKDFFTGKEIWHGDPAGEAEWYGNRTSQLWKDLGEAIGVSPERFKAAVETIITRDSIPMKLAGVAYDEVWREVPKPQQEGVLANFLIENWGKGTVGLARETNRWSDRMEELDVEGAKKYQEVDTMANLLIQGIYVTEQIEEERLYDWMEKLNNEEYKRVRRKVFDFHELLDLPDRSMWFRLGTINAPEARAQMLWEWLEEHKDNPEKTEQIWEGIEILRQSSSSIIPRKSNSPFWRKFFELED